MPSGADIGAGTGVSIAWAVLATIGLLILGLLCWLATREKLGTRTEPEALRP